MNTEFDEELKRYYIDGSLVRAREFRGKVRYSALLYRVLVNDWAERELACPRCGATTLTWREPIRVEDEVANCDCQACGSPYYLIDSYLPQRGRVRSNTSRALLHRIERSTAPDLICLRYDREAFEVIDLFVVPGSCLRKEYLWLGDTPRFEAGHDTWCDISIGMMQHELGSAAIVDIVCEGEQFEPDEVMRAMAAADALLTTGT